MFQRFLPCFLMIWCAEAQDSLFSGKDTINVKTVLFRDTDSMKPCWAIDDVSLLLARKVMQDLVPKKLPADFDTLAKYIKSTLELVKTKSPPESATKLTLAAYDALGGYLKSVGIPILNEAYYAGNVQYSTVAEIHSLYGRIMCFLKTDGGGWSGPIDMRKIPTKVKALPVSITNCTEACSTLEMRAAQVPENPYTMSDVSKVSIPYLDDNSYPNAIAIPLKGNSLFSLMSNCSANLLPKYYILAMRCLSSSCFNKKDIINFNHKFYDWIISSVVPHVHETQRWYPGFGGVMRIVETMNQKGLAGLESVRPDTSPCDNSLPPMKGVDAKGKPWYQRFMFPLILGGIVLLLLCSCSCYCIIRQCFKPPSPDPDQGEGLAKTLVSIYCGVKDTIVGAKPPCPPCPCPDESKSSSKSASGGYDCRGPFYSSTDRTGDSTATSSAD